MIKIKERPEDFIVKERLNLELDESGKYSYYKLWKNNNTQFEALKQVARILNVQEKYINFAGTKDKRAITEQFISVLNGKKIDIIHDNIKLNYLGRGKERISLGDLEGNEFEIKVITENEPKMISKVVNYFDNQRFGLNKNNHIIGKLLIKKEFKQACKILKETEPCVRNYLLEKETDYIGAIRTINRRILTIYIGAYQGYLFNEMCKQEVKKKEYYEVDYNLGKLFFTEKIDNKELPLIGFDSEKCDEILMKEGVGLRDFIMRSMPELSLAGSKRDMVVEIEDLEVEETDDGYVLKFFLPKASYATIVVKAMFG